MKRGLPFFITLAALSGLSILANPGGFFEEGSSSVRQFQDKSGRTNQISETRKYDFVYFYRDKQSYQVLFDILIQDHYIVGNELSSSKIYVRAREGEGYKNTLWEINEKAHHMSWEHGYLKFVKYGCCASLALNSYYNKRTGELLSRSTAPLHKVEIKKIEATRFVGFVSEAAVAPPAELSAHPNAVGVLVYANRFFEQTRVVVEHEEEIDFYQNPKINFVYRSLERDSLSIFDEEIENERSISGFHIKLDFGHHGAISIPIEGDAPALSRAAMAKGFSLKELPAGGPLEYLKDERFYETAYLDPAELRLLRNEIFARHGHSFQDPQLRAHFAGKSWYREKAGHNVDPSQLDPLERMALQKIARHESLK